jgi:hypothetical protein
MSGSGGTAPPFLTLKQIEVSGELLAPASLAQRKLAPVGNVNKTGWTLEEVRRI